MHPLLQTLVQVGLYPMGRSAHIFQDPLSYDPSRWMRRDDTNFKALAFGFGSRQCIGRRIAETEMMLFLMHVSAGAAAGGCCGEGAEVLLLPLIHPTVSGHSL